jgi:hypothetical protein
MPDWFGWLAVGAAAIGRFVALYVLMVKTQAGDPMKRREDSFEPPAGVA